MRSNHDPAIVTLFHSTLEHTLDHFLEFWIFEGVRHFLAIFAQPPTTLLTLVITMLLIHMIPQSSYILNFSWTVCTLVVYFISMEIFLMLFQAASS